MPESEKREKDYVGSTILVEQLVIEYLVPHIDYTTALSEVMGSIN